MAPAAPNHSMTTRLKAGITKPVANKDEQWRAAITIEINALMKNNTWSLVPPSPSQHTVGCKWVFHIKRNSDGSVERYKACLVGKGFHQQHGVDYAETYSPEDVYMSQPPGFVDLSRPNIAIVVNSISQYMSQPRIPHFTAVKHILRYIKGTIDQGLMFSPQRQPVHLSAYYDADWAGCHDTRRSTSGYLIFLGSNLISWCSKKQPTISRSSAESEYRSLAHVSAETTWLAYLLHDLGAHIQFPIMLYCDNLSATYMASNPIFHARTKHIELDCHFVREKVFLGSHHVNFIPTQDQQADLLTKPLHKPRHHLLTSKLICVDTSSLRGVLATISLSIPQITLSLRSRVIRLN
ncbi:hypothetical protein ACLB2K_059919 [Fragaria x ananassa]